jgi:hypothetical protein
MDAVANDFGPLRAKLDELENAYNPGRGNLHFTSLERVDSALFASLLGLAREGMGLVREHREFFSTRDLYDDGMVWYNLFLLVSSAGACRARAKGTQDKIPPETIMELAETLVDISEFTTATFCDILKRNHEALANLLLAFHSPALVESARKRARDTGLKRVEEFVDYTVRAAEQLL